MNKKEKREEGGGKERGCMIRLLIKVNLRKASRYASNGAARLCAPVNQQQGIAAGHTANADV